jgi:hypothetical protein
MSKKWSGPKRMFRTPREQAGESRESVIFREVMTHRGTIHTELGPMLVIEPRRADGSSAGSTG